LKRLSLECDVEAFLDNLDSGCPLDFVVTGVYSTDSFGVFLLCCSYGCPQNSFTASSCIAEYVNMASAMKAEPYQHLPEWVKEANNTRPVISIRPVRIIYLIPAVVDIGDVLLGVEIKIWFEQCLQDVSSIFTLCCKMSAQDP